MTRHEPLAPLQIEREDPKAADIRALIARHLEESRAAAPPESDHALSPEDLAGPELRFLAARAGTELAGIGAIFLHPDGVAELKSMRTAAKFRRRGVATQVLYRLMEEALSCGATRIALETGSMDTFAAARTFYARHGFAPCPPFGAYVPDRNSVFLSRALAGAIDGQA